MLPALELEALLVPFPKPEPVRPPLPEPELVPAPPDPLFEPGLVVPPLPEPDGAGVLLGSAALCPFPLPE